MQVKRILQGIAWSALIALCSIGSLQAQRVKMPKPVMAVDAQGNEIGTVLKMDFSQQRMQVAIEINDTLVPILVKKNSFSHSSRPMVYFRSDDCTGMAFLGSGSQAEDLSHPVGVAGDRGTVYWGYPETLQLREIFSALFGAECREFEATLMVMDADPMMHLADEFTPPFGIASAAEEDRRGQGRTDGRSRARD